MMRRNRSDSHRRSHRFFAFAIWLGLIVLHHAAAEAATPLEVVRLSPDITVELDGSTFEDEDAASDDQAGTVSMLSIGAVPPGADLDAYHLLDDGDQLLSFDTAVELPGGLTAKPGDVVRFDGISHTIEFDAAAEGLPDGVNLDAVTVVGPSLALSFDVTVDLGGMTVDDEDLVLFDGIGFGPFFDGSAAGLGAGLALDAAHHVGCNGHLLLSFDGTGEIGGVTFDDDDLLEHDGLGTWEVAYDGAVLPAAWTSADLDAVHATPDLGPPTVFGQTIRAGANKIDFEWPDPAAFEAARGPFVAPADIGDYAFDATASGNGTSVSDPTIPPAGTGFWYLVKPGGCVLGSWQTTPGAEPDRDVFLP